MRMFGWQAEEMIDEPIARIIPPDRRREEEDMMAALERGERLEPFDTERITKDGRRIAVSVTVSPIRDAAGRLVGASKIAREASGREAAHAAHLIEELNHRVRNTLATIQAMAGQSLRRSSSPEAFARSFSGRVQALARVHDLLIIGDMAGADLSAIISGELPSEGFGMRIALEGPQVMLEPRVAVQMALVVHELADNARRHGALGDSPGRLTVAWRIEAGPQGMRLVLDWREHGSAALASPDVTPGGGFLLIERSLAVNGGAGMRRSEPGGFAWEIVLPLPGLPAALPSDPPSPMSATSAPWAGTLDGCRVLVVEDESLIAMDIESQLAAAGAIVVGPVGIMSTAAHLIESKPLDAALLDATLAGEPVDALAIALEARGVPFAFSSGHELSGLPEGFRDRPLLRKPFSAEELLASIRALLAPAEGATVTRLRRRD